MSPMSMITMMNNIRMSCLSLVLHLHGGATIVICNIGHMLYPAIRKSHCVFPLYIASLVTRPVLTEVCVILVIMHSIFKVEGVWLFIIAITMTMTSIMTANKSSSDSMVSNTCRTGMGNTQ